MKNNKILLFLYRESVGEINVALPIIQQITRKMNIDNVYFHFTSKDKYNNIDSTYKKIINEFGKKTIGNFDFLKLLFKLIDKNIIVVSSDYCPVFELNQIQKNFPNSTTILMHHAQSILYKKDNTNNNKTFKKKSKKDIYNPDIFLVGNRIDFNNNYFEFNNYNIKKEKILFIGALNYEKEWINFLLKKEKDFNYNLIEEKKKYDKTILVTTRAPHKEYMMQKDYEYQVSSILEVASIFPNFLFIVKPHPREKVKVYKESFSSFKELPNLIVSTLNTYRLCSYSDLVISFWSSVIQDCAITKKPVIEFHRHNKKNEKLLIYHEDRFKSFFEYYGFCSFTNSKEDLITYIKDKDKEELLNSQIENINKIFIATDDEINNTLNKIVQINSIKNKGKNQKKLSKTLISIKFFKNYFIKTINKKLKKD